MMCKEYNHFSSFSINFFSYPCISFLYNLSSIIPIKTDLLHLVLVHPKIIIMNICIINFSFNKEYVKTFITGFSDQLCIY